MPFAAGLTATQLALLGVTAEAPQGTEPQEVAQKMAQDRYWQHVALRDSLPHVTGAEALVQSDCAVTLHPSSECEVIVCSRESRYTTM